MLLSTLGMKKGGSMSIDHTIMQKIVRKYYEQLYVNIKWNRKVIWKAQLTSIGIRICNKINN